MSAYRRRRRRSGPDLAGLLALGPLPLAAVLVAALGWYHFLFGGFAVEGVVRDAQSGEPVPQARVWAGAGAAETAADGTFRLAGVKPPEALAVVAPGYAPATARPLSPLAPVAVALQPRSFELVVEDAATGAPLTKAVARLGERQATAVGEGLFRFAPIRPGQRITVSAAGYVPRDLTYEDGQQTLEVALEPSLAGTVVDAATGAPVPGARIALGGTVLTSDARGAYALAARPGGARLTVLAPGYRKFEAALAAHTPLDVRLQPLEVKGLYFSRAALSLPEYRRRMRELLDTTELNAVVLDVKGDHGLLSYRSGVPLAETLGANAAPTIQDLEALLQPLRQRGVYLIARIVVFKDDVLARHGARAGLDVAVKDRRGGVPWVDGEGLAWVDPFQAPAWDYNVALAREAIERGFDEVQFDYVRFPTDPPPGGSIDDTLFSRPSTAATRVAALEQFLARAHQAVNDAGGYLAIDTFGYTTWWADDGGIGQDLARLADEVDYLSPMVYPSTFSAGLPGSIPYPAVVRKPYETLYESLVHARRALAGARAVLRPWLQYFDDYPWATGLRYDAPQIEAQKRAVADAGAKGWMLWDPTNLYERGGLAAAD